MECPHCRTPLPSDRKFCGECGLNLLQPAEIPLVDYSQPRSYTPKYLVDKILTSRSSLEGERKVVTVLFADVANYTGISENLAPEEVHEIMNGCFDILMEQVHRYEGTINQFTGDGIMALFGAPVAHEDHAQRGCYAALSICGAMGAYGEKVREAFGVDFAMRMGLNSGPVIVGCIGDDLRMDYTALGDTTNLASRIQDLARPGSVLISGHTHKLVRGYFEFESLGKRRVKGKRERPETYELVRSTGVESRIQAAKARGLTRFVGRRKELKDLGEAWDKARSGSGQVVGIVGDAGVGKSRLFLEFRSRLPREDYTYLEGRCFHYGSSMAYLPILDILKAYFGIEEEVTESIIKERIEVKLRGTKGKPQSVPAALHELLSLKVEDEKYLQLGPQQRRERSFEAARDLLVRESRRKPLLLVVEDLHWIDQTSQGFLDYLIGVLSKARILLVLLYRNEYTHNWWSKPYCRKILANQLSAQTSATLVQAILEEGEVDPELMEFVIGKAGGNPLFVEELTHTLLESGSILRKKERYVLSRKGAEIEVPGTIVGIIGARLDRVESSLKQTLQVASVIGRRFSYRILEAITGRKDGLKADLLSLQKLEFIYVTQIFPEQEYSFKHALTQEVAYKSLLLKRRVEIHESIGRAIEFLHPESLEEHYELLAYHYARSNNQEKAVEYLDLANQKTARASAMEQAKAYFDKAMELLGTLPESEENRERRTALLVNQSIVFELLLQWTEYYDLLTRYKSHAMRVRDPLLLAAYYDRMAGCEWSFGLFDESIRTSSKAIELGETAGSREHVAYAFTVLACSYLWKGDFMRAVASKEEALRRMDPGGNIYLYGRVLCMGSLAFTSLGRWDKALEEGRKALAAAEEISDASQICSVASTISVVHNFKGDVSKAEEYGELAVRKAPTPMDKGWAEACLAWAWSRKGDPARGVEILAPFVELAQAAHYLTGVFPGMHWLGEAHWLAGEHEKGRRTLDELRCLAERCGARHYSGLAHATLAAIALETDPAGAAAHFGESIAVFRETKAENDLALACAGYGRLHKRQGRAAEARRYLGEALKIFERLGTAVEPDKVRRDLADLPGGC